MNKPLRLMLLLLAVFVLPACSEKKQYEAAVLAEMQSEPDIKDYKLDPAVMAACIVEATSRKMPGVFPFDPDRKKAYSLYVKMLTLQKAKDPMKEMADLRTEFGSPQGLLEARSNYTDSLVDCQTTLITNAEPVDKPTVGAQVATTPAPVAPSAATGQPAAVAPVIPSIAPAK